MIGSDDLVCANVTYLEDKTIVGEYITTSTVYENRGDNFKDNLENTLESHLAEIKSNLTFEITPYHNSHLYTAHGPVGAITTETDNGQSLCLQGTKDEVTSALNAIADSDYGVFQYNDWLAKWNHPVQSLRGHSLANSVKNELEERFEEKRSLDGDYRVVVEFVKKE